MSSNILIFLSFEFECNEVEWNGNNLKFLSFYFIPLYLQMTEFITISEFDLITSQRECALEEGKLTLFSPNLLWKLGFFNMLPK